MRLTLEELRRNPELRQLGGMEHAEAVPKAWNIGHFLSVLGREPYRSLLKGVFDQLVERLGTTIMPVPRPSPAESTPRQSPPNLPVLHHATPIALQRNRLSGDLTGSAGGSTLARYENSAYPLIAGRRHPGRP